MGKVLAIFAALSLALFGAMPAFADSAPKTIGYYFIPSAGQGLRPSRIPADRYSHLVYAFLNVSPEGKCALIDRSAGYRDRDGTILRELSGLKRSHPGLKTLFSIGGSVHSVGFSNASRTDASRKRLVRSCIEILEKYGLDGIDVDWEAVGYKTSKNPASRPEDPANFIKLLAEFRAQLPPKALLSAAIGVDAYTQGFLAAKDLAKLLDWIGLMNYDLCGSRSKLSCHPSEFGATTRSAIRKFTDAGAKPEQIVVGVPFYGTPFKVRSTERLGIGQDLLPADGLDDLPYRRIEAQFRDRAGYRYAWDDAAREPVLVNAERKTIIGFDDPRSIRLKAETVKRERLGGILVWEVMGDAPGNPLLEAIRQGFKD